MADSRTYNEVRRSIAAIEGLLEKLLLDRSGSVKPDPAGAKLYESCLTDIRGNLPSTQGVPLFLFTDTWQDICRDISRAGKSEGFETYLKPIRGLMRDLPEIWGSRTERIAVAQAEADTDQPPFEADPDSLRRLLQSMKMLCASLLSQPEDEAGPGASIYASWRAQILMHGKEYAPAIVESSLTLPQFYLNCETLSRDRDQIGAIVQAQFDAILETIADRAGKRTATDSFSWTGRATVEKRVIRIRQFAPIVLGALDQIIELHVRTIHNQVPTERQLEAISMLRELHRELGALLVAVESERPFQAALERVARIANRAFRIVADSGEVFVAGAPALAATAIASIGAIKGLEMLGIDLDSTGQAAIATGAAAIFATNQIAAAKNP